MQCDICSRPGGSKLPFMCPIDARNYLYRPRIENATILIEKNTLDQQATAVLSARKRPSELIPIISRIDMMTIQTEKDQILDRTQLIISKADELRGKVEKARQDLARRKAAMSRRKTDLISASRGLDGRRNRIINELEKSVQTIRVLWYQVHVTTTSARAFLCSEAARLYGLKRVKTKDNNDEYKIGGIVVMDLRRLNTASAAQISTALSHIVHLLMLSAHYLGIRLPAEITLPHRNYPLPTVFPRQYSYKYSNVPFPGISSQSNMNASRYTEKSHQPRPRPLFIHKPLPLVSNEDPAEYAFFLEGVSLLAYNVAWMCKSQGIAVGEEDRFRDICNIGRNMVNLLTSARPRVPLKARVSTARPPINGIRRGDSDTEDRNTPYPELLGKYSHSAAYSFLGNAEGINMIRSWDLPSPAEIADRLRSHLMSEVANAEWEVLNADAWEGNQNSGEKIINKVTITGQDNIDRPSELEMQSFMSTRTVIDVAEHCGAEGERKVGTSGWTKLKPR